MRPLRGGEAAYDAQPPPRATGRFHLTTRGGHDVLDDRETQTSPARCARAVAAIEPLEEPRQLALLHTSAVVGDLDLARARRQQQRRSRPGVADRAEREVLDD